MTFLVDVVELLRHSLRRGFPVRYNSQNRSIIFERLNVEVAADAPCRWCDRKRQPFTIGSLWLFLTSSSVQHSVKEADSYGFQFVSVLERRPIREFFLEGAEVHSHHLDVSVPLCEAHPSDASVPVDSKFTYPIPRQINDSDFLRTSDEVDAAAKRRKLTTGHSSAPHHFLRKHGGHTVSGSSTIYGPLAIIERQASLRLGDITGNFERGSMAYRKRLRDLSATEFDNVCGRGGSNSECPRDSLPPSASVLGADFATRILPVVEPHLLRRPIGLGAVRRAANRCDAPTLSSLTGAAYARHDGPDGRGSVATTVQRRGPSLWRQLQTWKAWPIILIPSESSGCFMNYSVAETFFKEQKFPSGGPLQQSVAVPASSVSWRESQLRSGGAASRRFMWEISPSDCRLADGAAKSGGGPVDGGGGGGGGGMGLMDGNDPSRVVSPSMAALPNNNSTKHVVGKFRSKVMDSASVLRFTKSHWYATVAVFLNGSAWQFRDWPFKDFADLFSCIKGYYVALDDDEIPPFVAKWPIQVLRIRRHARHGDPSIWVQLVSSLESFLRKPRDFKKFDKERLAVLSSTQSSV